MRNIRLYTPLLLTLSILTAVSASGFNLSVESEIGYQTNIPGNEEDSLFGNYPVLGITIDPSWSCIVARSVLFSAHTECDLRKYIGGSGELAVAQKLAFEEETDSRIIGGALGASYNYLPAAYDPTTPVQYMEYSLSGELGKRGGGLPLSGTCSISLLDDIGSSRFDIRNSLRLKAGLTISGRVYLFVKTGCVWDVSNTGGAGYIQPLLSGGVSVAPDDENMFMAQLYGAYSFFKPANVPVLVPAGKSGRGKVKDTLSIESPVTGIPFTTLYLGYNRELQYHTSLQIYYMAALFGRGEADNMFLSHQAGVSIGWSRK